MTADDIKTAARVAGLVLDDAAAADLAAAWPQLEKLLARVRHADPLAGEPVMQFVPDERR